MTRTSSDSHTAVVAPDTGEPVGGWYEETPVAACAGQLYLTSDADSTRTDRTTVVDARTGGVTRRIGATLLSITGRGDLVFDSPDVLTAYHLT
ncbi:MAG TPA: hypothetical protein VGL93_24390 [Streptosporangiaceae bacterium]